MGFKNAKCFLLKEAEEGGKERDKIAREWELEILIFLSRPDFLRAVWMLRMAGKSRPVALSGASVTSRPTEMEVILVVG